MVEPNASNNVPGILILSHGPLCKSLIESAKMINGDMQGVKALSFDEETNIDTYAQKAKTILESMPPGSIVLFDLFSGTPFNQLIMLCEGVGVDGLCGVNLPMLLDALVFRESKRGAELVKAVESSTHESIVNVSEFMSKVVSP